MANQRIGIRTARQYGDRRSLALSRSLRVGAVIQALLIGLPVLDFWVLGSVRRHVQTAYPHWGLDNVNADTLAITIAMVGVGALGVGGWLAALLITRHGRWTRTVVTSALSVGALTLACIAGFADGPYHPIVPLWMGVTTFVVPVGAGCAALVAAWRGPR